MKAGACILLFALALTGVIVTTVAGISVSVFFVLLVIATPLFLASHLMAGKGLDLMGVGLVCGVMVALAILNLHTTKLTSLIYSVVFLTAFLMIVNGMKHVSKERFGLVLKAILILYFVNIMLAHVFIVAGISPGFLSGLFQRTLEYGTDLQRPYGFSSEPSYAAFIVTLSFYALYALGEVRGRGAMFFYGTLMLLSVIVIHSMYGYLLATAIVIAVATRELPKRSTAFLLVALLLVGAVTNLDTLFSSGDRFIRIVVGLLSGEIHSVLDLNEVDSSLFMRIAPFVEYVNGVHLTDIHTFIGHGAMASTGFATEAFYEHMHIDTDSDLLRLGFLPSFLYDFGLVGAAIVLTWVFKRIIDNDVPLASVFFVSMLFNANFNTQLFWFVVIVLSMTKLYLSAEPKTDSTLPTGNRQLSNEEADEMIEAVSD